jgi:hypothetical protein
MNFRRMANNRLEDGCYWGKESLVRVSCGFGYALAQDADLVDGYTPKSDCAQRFFRAPFIFESSFHLTPFVPDHAAQRTGVPWGAR